MKKILIFSLALFTIATFTACNNKANENNNSTEITQPNTGDSSTSNDQESSSPSNTEDEAGSKQDNSNGIDAVYIGQADPHSIEVYIENAPAILQIDQVMDQFNSLNLKENDKVIVTYTINEYNQYIVTEISK